MNNSIRLRHTFKPSYFNIFILAFLWSHLSCQTVEAPRPSKDKYRFYEQIEVDGFVRTYLLVLPDDYYREGSDRPLLIGLHGAGGSGSQFENDYGLGAMAARHGYIAVYPEGIRKENGILKLRTWNAGGCCDYAMRQNINDVKFIQAVIDQLNERLRVDTKKIYVAGMSNGGMLAYRLASELSQTIAAIAIVSGTMVSNKDEDRSGAVPVLHIHSEKDKTVPFDGGEGIGGYYFPPVMDGIGYWEKRNGCAPLVSEKHYDGYKHLVWNGEQKNQIIECYLTEDGGHSWPGAFVKRHQADAPSEAINANPLILSFFERFSLN